MKKAKDIRITAAKQLTKIAKGLVAVDSPKDKIYQWLNSNTSFYSETGYVSVGWRIDPRFAGDYPVQVTLCTTIKGFWQGSGNALIRDIKSCQSKIGNVEKGLRKQFPGIVLKVMD